MVDGSAKPAIFHVADMSIAISLLLLLFPLLIVIIFIREDVIIRRIYCVCALPPFLPSLLLKYNAINLSAI
jgi:hypothetical protein